MSLLDVCNLSKSFTIYDSPAKRLRERLFGGNHHTTYHALKAIDFSLEAGEAVAIIGQNGAGKSTFLKLISGVLLADEGEIRRQGSITGLLELGTGFDMELSGRENIALNARLLGMSAQITAERTEEIIDFAELGSYIDVPVRTYSSGMLMRLGFSIAIHADPACFVVDEALSVGDVRFQQKCLEKIREFQSHGGALLFVSHDLAAVKLLCNRAIVLDDGEFVFEGSAEDAVNFYYQLIAGMDSASVVAGRAEGYGLQQIRMQKVRLLNQEGQDVTSFSSGDVARVEIEVKSNAGFEELNMGLLLRDRFGQDIFGTNTGLLDQPLSFEEGELAYVHLSLPLNLGVGQYSITLALHSGINHLKQCQHWWDNAFELEVAGYTVPVFSGVTYLPINISKSSIPDAIPDKQSPLS